MTAGMSYHRRRAAKCLASGYWSMREIQRFHEYGWLRSLDKTPARPLQRLVQAERRLA